MKKEDLTQEELKRWLHYDSLTGVWTNIKERHKCPVGKVLGSIAHNGYISIGLLGYQYYAHRLGWLYETGSFPKKGLDHRDKNRQNNKFLNLREASDALNSTNRLKSVKNTSGTTGVIYCNSHNKWRAQIMVERKQVFLGLFTDKQLAINARREAERDYGFTNE